MVLTYCPKRIGYKNDAYIAKHMLAFIDYNSHLGRKQLERSDGTPVFVARFGKRTKQWYATPVLCEKEYSYVPGITIYKMFL